MRKIQIDLAFPDSKTDMISSQRSFDYDAAMAQISVNKGIRVQMLYFRSEIAFFTKSGMISRGFRFFTRSCKRPEVKSCRTLPNLFPAILTIGLVAGTAFPQEREIRRPELPAAVEETVAKVSRNAIIKRISEETQNGKTTYEVEMVFHAHSKDAEIDADGKVAEAEEEVAMSSIPTIVQAALTARAAGGKILKVESLTKQARLVAYEARVEQTGKRTEIRVGPDGKPLDQEE